MAAGDYGGRMQRRRFSARILLVAAMLLGLLTAAIIPGTPAVQAQGGDFEIYSDLITLSDAGDTGTFEIGVRSLNSTVAAVDGTVTFDAAALTATSCAPLVDLGACNTATDGEMRFAAVVADGFTNANEVPLFQIIFTADGPDGTFEINAALTAAYDAGLNVVTGDLLTGSVTVGGTVGDVNCDNQVIILDAYIVSQAAVGLRTASTCPLSDPATQYASATADMTGNGEVNILDAYAIARCAVGLDDCG